VAELTDTQLAFIEWRADPARQGTKQEWADTHDVNVRTLNKCEKTPWFREGLERRLTELNISPDRIQAVLDALWKDASRGDAASARAYLAAVDDMRPPRPKLEDNSIVSLSDEELELAWKDGLAALKRARA
jgi:hypothetical protein